MYLKRFIFTLILVGYVIGLSFNVIKAHFKATGVFSTTIPDFAAVAKRNSQLKYSLKWSFGRRSQSGWYLYAPLIKHAVGTEKSENSIEFARKVYAWQKGRRIFASGLVDRKTLYSFIKYWQSNRLRPIVIARESQLLTAPIADFYDSTRDVRLLKVQKDAYLAYKRLIIAAMADGVVDVQRSGQKANKSKFMKIISSYRSPAYQASLRKKEPKAGRAQIAFRSPHFTGRALDIYVGGKPVTTKDFNRAIQVKTPSYKWLVKNAERFGFYPYFYEPWHWEYVPRNLSKKTR